jgi:hypothetical protein
MGSLVTGLCCSPDASGRNVMTIITIITLFATLTTPSEKPSDLCDIVYADTGRPVWCEPHRDGAPRLDDMVCCDAAGCIAAHSGGCAQGRTAYHCELGQVWADGDVSCYFEVPDYCDVFPCAPGFQTWPQANPMCCSEGVCWNTNVFGNDCEPQDIYWCSDGVTNSDGTVTCFDD